MYHIKKFFLVCLTLLAFLLTSCSVPRLTGDSEIDIPGDHNFRMVLRKYEEPVQSQEERREEGIKAYGFDPTAITSRSALAKYAPGEKITVPVEKYFCLDCPTVSQYGIQPFYEHYRSSALFSYQVWNAYQECLRTSKPVTPTPPSNTPNGCRACKGDGCLWKPLTETRGGVAALLLDASKYQGLKVDVRDGSARVIDQTCCANGNRSHWYFSKRGSAIGHPIILDISNGECISIPDPSKRYE